MKIAFITDIHAYAFNDFSRNTRCYWNNEKKRYLESEDGDLVLNSRLFNILSGLVDIRDYCVKHGINLVLNGGDTYHKRATLDVTTFNCTYKVLESFKDFGIRQIIISGNHDNAINADNSPSSIETFRNFADVVTMPKTIPIENDGRVIRICCLPWLKTKHDAIEYMEECMKTGNSNNILLAHLGVSGASLGSGYVMSDDYSLSELKPNKWKYVLLGHYHKPQILHENTIYGGSPLQNDFGDEGDHHGFWVIDTDKRWDMELISLDYPEFMSLTADTIKNFDTDVLEYNYVRIQATASELESLQEELEDVGEVRIEIEKEYVKNSRSDISVTMSTDDIIKAYVEENTKEQTNSQKESTLNKGLEIMRKVVNK